MGILSFDGMKQYKINVHELIYNFLQVSGIISHAYNDQQTYKVPNYVTHYMYLYASGVPNSTNAYCT